MTNDELITCYFRLNRRISACEKRIIELREDFYSQSMTNRVLADGDHLYTAGFDVELNVIRIVDAIAKTEKDLSSFQFKHTHFNRYLSRLKEQDKASLVKNYNKAEPTRGDPVKSHLKKVCLEEIQEIEMAALHRFGVDSLIDKEDDE